MTLGGPKWVAAHTKALNWPGKAPCQLQAGRGPEEWPTEARPLALTFWPV